MSSKLISDKITIQSMTTTKTDDVKSTVAQIKRLEALGCDIIRVAVPDIPSANAITKIKEQIDIPLVADIHFNYKLAIRAVEAGADKIRINPGNIGSSDGVKAIADVCNKKDVPIRIGVNSGSLSAPILEKYNGVTPEAMIESVMENVKLLNKYDFDNIWISAKGSNVPLTVKTYRLLHERTKYPLHIGITEAGTEYAGIIKSAIGIGSLLMDGIGNTIRVSLTEQPEREIDAAVTILKSIGLRPGIDIISCPTCGRCNIDVIELTKMLESKVDNVLMSKLRIKNPHHRPPFLYHNLTIAVMGCAVNGPGEAKLADYGIAGGHGEGIIFANGEIIKKAPMNKLISELLAVIEAGANN
ncbi:MAG: flavodoxin-dependent (E)-4-hydroxy-3-methylbut-2-enyl-diphosphate synthase [Oscillospiraceae bacterium]|jgi:(E)-4-hydroxy-3-methylbut-2-enyl-diphosphate synthase|nr:flavodoxin-dependent (E)-4-hydroxy-3-methylbut-2-enyl-diphosphate synthase [Oscillospiraceae bacterium]